MVTILFSGAIGVIVAIVAEELIDRYYPQGINTNVHPFLINLVIGLLIITPLSFVLMHPNIIFDFYYPVGIIIGEGIVYTTLPRVFHLIPGVEL